MRKGAKPVSIEILERACLKGAESALRKYVRLSGGYGLKDAPESFLQAEIAYAVMKCSRYVTLECGVDMLLREAGAERRGRQPRSGRFDIVTWWENGKPRFIVEVKKATNTRAIDGDVQRIRQVLNRGGTARAGLVIAYSDATTTETLDDRFDKLAVNSGAIRSIAAAPKIFHMDDGRARYGQAVCFRVNATRL